ncbi:hypothetical protein M3Y97_01120000 [Aphelenchoides bicaudatus]|nr:hypothetical protein M3Y97_01120000 [Aphelenchoides bicaudatus]
MGSYDYNNVYTCHAKGNGTKNIVLIGNSHIMHDYPGIWYMFRNIYKTMTLFARNGCIPASKKFQLPGLPENVKDECVRFIQDTIPSLQQWKEPIDIIIAFYAFVEIPLLEREEDYKQDEFFKELNDFYSTVAKIPKDALLFYQNFPYFEQTPINELGARLKWGKSWDTIGDKREDLMKRYTPPLTRVEHIKCDKCIKLKFMDLWCPLDEKSFCHSVQKEGLIYFVDRSHPSLYGSFFTGKYILDHYNEFMKHRA